MGRSNSPTRITHPVLVLGELESILIDRERSVEPIEQRGGKRLFELADQRWIKGIKSGKTNAQLGIITIKNNVLLTVVSFTFFRRALLLFDTSFCAVCASAQYRLVAAKVPHESASLEPIAHPRRAS
jgi:hypothetical protein